MTVSREEMLALADSIENNRIESEWGRAQVMLTAIEQATVVAALRADAELDHRTSGEPVAWRWRIKDIPQTEWYFSQHDPAQFNRLDIEYEPLYSSLPDHQSAASHSQEGVMEATAAQHSGLKGKPAQFVRNGKLETCRCFDCRELASQAGSEASSGALRYFVKQIARYELSDQQAIRRARELLRAPEQAAQGMWMDHDGGD